MHAAHVLEFLVKSKISVMKHPLYSPDLALCDFWLFPRLKEMLCGQKFNSNHDFSVQGCIKLVLHDSLVRPFYLRYGLEIWRVDAKYSTEYDHVLSFSRVISTELEIRANHFGPTFVIYLIPETNFNFI